MLPAGKLVTFGGSFVVDDFARFLKLLALTGSAVAILMSFDYLSHAHAAEVRIFDPDPAFDHRHADADLGGRPDRALSRPRTDEPGALRGGGDQSRFRALDRGRPEIFRARRAVLRHAALRRVADLRLHRHGVVCRHRAGRRPRAISASSSGWCSCSPASASRSRRCRSTCGRRTSTRVRRRRSRRSSPPRRRSPASRCSCAPPSWRFPASCTQWQQIVVFVAIASMGLGAFAAIGQRNIKRLMAYSSIGHMGFALVGLAAGTPEGVQGVLVYMAIYLTMTLGTFACILSMRRDGRMVEGDLRSCGARAHQPDHGVLPGAAAVLARRDSAARGLFREVLRVPGGDQGRAVHACGDRRASPAWSAPTTIC